MTNPFAPCLAAVSEGVAKLKSGNMTVVDPTTPGDGLAQAGIEFAGKLM